MLLRANGLSGERNTPAQRGDGILKYESITHSWLADEEVMTIVADIRRGYIPRIQHHDPENWYLPAYCFPIH